MFSWLLFIVSVVGVLSTGLRYSVQLVVELIRDIRDR